MTTPEIPLSGGQLTSVVRIGETVHRSTGPWSPAVHALLRHLEAVGFDGAARFRGIDQGGREILTYLDGDAGFFSPDQIVPPTLWSDDTLIEAGTILRRFHDATANFRLPAGLQWQTDWPCPPPHQVICHNDFAPYNCIFRDGHLVATIDLDGAAPGSRTWDLAYAAYTFVPLYTDEGCRAVGLTEPPNRPQRLRLLCDAYGLVERTDFVETIEARVRSVGAMIQAFAAAGDGRFQQKIDEGHLDGYTANADFLRVHRNKLQEALG